MNEPAYKKHKTIVCSFRYPDYVSHEKTIRCKKEHPHKIEECNECKGGIGFIIKFIIKSAVLKLFRKC